MRNHALGVVTIVLALAAPAAWADDKSECTAGIRQIKAAIAKKPAKGLLEQLQKSLKTAEQEVDEGDYDECVVAVREGRKAMRGK